MRLRSGFIRNETGRGTEVSAGAVNEPGRTAIASIPPEARTSRGNIGHFPPALKAGPDVEELSLSGMEQ
ncbi:MAG TPA: hypothetical protein VHB50_16285 [Bryobacteraceae bacterium]|nr:hypothetical protein [Bryobacteraceae bacterium]